jgi:hypothetical protein
VGASRPSKPRTRTKLVGRQTGDAAVDPAILALQEAVRRLEGKEDPEPPADFVLSILPVPAATAAVQEESDGTFSTNEAGNPIQDLYAVNLHLTGAYQHGSRFIEYPPELNAILTGTPINFTNGRGVGSAAGACSFFVTMPPLLRGDRILAVSGVFAVGLGAGTSSINLKRRNADLLAPTTLGTASSGVGAGGNLVVTLSGLTETVVAGKSYVLEVNTGRAQDSLETITVEYDHP